MKIASNSLLMDSSHISQQHYERQESLRLWVGTQRPSPGGSDAVPATRGLPVSEVQISQAGALAQSDETDAIAAGLRAAENDPMLQLLRAMIAILTGEEVRIFDAGDLASDTPAVDVPVENTGRQQSAGYGIEYDRHESYRESEQTRFAASGTIRTSDGKEISFDLSLMMSRSYAEESNLSIRQGDARRKQDPLILNFNGSAAQLTSQRFKFDIDSNGTTENINFVTNGSGFLALDRNGDGKINNGSELFGTISGNGFADLSSLDGDHNGWIDENDAAFANLRIWTKDGAGQDQLATLKQANVGALNLASIATPFDLKDQNNALLGQVRSSGVFLKENGQVGTIQQIDLTV